MFSRLIISLLIFIFLQISSASAARYASIIVDEMSGSVLHAVNPDRKIYPASLTKMMTLYLVFEKLRSGSSPQIDISERCSLLMNVLAGGRVPDI